MKTELKKLPHSKIEIHFELDEKEFAAYIEKALEHLKKHVKMDGFRVGTVPKEMVEKKVGDENLLMEAGDLAVKESYIKFVREYGLETVGNPDVQMKKIAKGSECMFTATVTVVPEMVLPDYKTIAAASKGKEVDVDQKEIDEALAYLQKSRAKFSQVDRAAKLKDFIELSYSNEHINGGNEVKDRFIVGEGGFLKDFEDNIIGMKAGEEKEFSATFPENAPNNLGGKKSQFKVKVTSVQEMDLPELNDEFAKGLGVFDSMAALKENLHQGIAMEKQEAQKHQHRQDILASIAREVKLEVPEEMLSYEQNQLFEDFKRQITQQARMTFEEYLANVKKSEKEIKDSFAKEAEKRIKNFLVLRQIGRAENVEPSKEELEEEINKHLRKYTQKQTEEIDIAQLREYSKNVIVSEKIFQVLENFSKNV